MTYDVEIRQLDLMALFDLKGSQSEVAAWCGATLPAFPDQPLRRCEAEERALMWLGPEHWILRAPLKQEESLLAALNPAEAPDTVSVVQISDTLSFFALTGPDVAEVMAVATPLDIHDSVFPPDAACFTDLFSVKALVLRIPGGFHLGVGRSFAPMIADYLARTTAG